MQTLNDLFVQTHNDYSGCDVLLARDAPGKECHCVQRTFNDARSLNLHSLSKRKRMPWKVDGCARVLRGMALDKARFVDVLRS